MTQFGKVQRVLIIALCLLAGKFCHAQMNGVDMAKVDSLMSNQAKPLLILLSTDWCTYCQMQKAQLRKDKTFTRQMNNFYYVEWNAESRKTIYFNKHWYHFKASSATTGIHELALSLNGSERIAYPTWVLLNMRYEVLFRHSGVLMPQQIHQLLKVIDKISND